MSTYTTQDYVANEIIDLTSDTEDESNVAPPVDWYNMTPEQAASFEQALDALNDEMTETLFA